MRSFDWQQFIFENERYKLTEQASLVVKHNSTLFFVGQMEKDSIQKIKELPHGKEVIVGNLSLLLFLNPGTTKEDAALGMDVANRFLLSDDQVNKFSMSYKRCWNSLGKELLPNIDINVEVIIEKE